LEEEGGAKSGRDDSTDKGEGKQKTSEKMKTPKEDEMEMPDAGLHDIE